MVQHNHVDRGFKILNKRSRPLPTGPNSRPREPNKGKKKHCQPCHVGPVRHFHSSAPRRFRSRISCSLFTLTRNTTPSHYVPLLAPLPPFLPPSRPPSLPPSLPPTPPCSALIPSTPLAPPRPRPPTPPVPDLPLACSWGRPVIPETAREPFPPSRV